MVSSVTEDRKFARGATRPKSTPGGEAYGLLLDREYLASVVNANGTDYVFATVFRPLKRTILREHAKAAGKRQCDCTFEEALRGGGTGVFAYRLLSLCLAREGDLPGALEGLSGFLKCEEYEGELAEYARAVALHDRRLNPDAAPTAFPGDKAGFDRAPYDEAIRQLALAALDARSRAIDETDFEAIRGILDEAAKIADAHARFDPEVDTAPLLAELAALCERLASLCADVPDDVAEPAMAAASAPAPKPTRVRSLLAAPAEERLAGARGAVDEAAAALEEVKAAIARGASVPVKDYARHAASTAASAVRLANLVEAAAQSVGASRRLLSFVEGAASPTVAEDARAEASVPAATIDQAARLGAPPKTEAKPASPTLSFGIQMPTVEEEPDRDGRRRIGLPGNAGYSPLTFGQEREILGSSEPLLVVLGPAEARPGLVPTALASACGNASKTLRLLHEPYITIKDIASAADNALATGRGKIVVVGADSPWQPDWIEEARDVAVDGLRFVFVGDVRRAEEVYRSAVGYIVDKVVRLEPMARSFVEAEAMAMGRRIDVGSLLERTGGWVGTLGQTMHDRLSDGRRRNPDAEGIAAARNAVRPLPPDFPARDFFLRIATAAGGRPFTAEQVRHWAERPDVALPLAPVHFLAFGMAAGLFEEAAGAGKPAFRFRPWALGHYADLAAARRPDA